MKKTYKTPNMTVSLFDIEDIITASGASLYGVDENNEKITGANAFVGEEYVGKKYSDIAWQ